MKTIPENQEKTPMSRSALPNIFKRNNFFKKNANINSKNHLNSKKAISTTTMSTFKGTSSKLKPLKMKVDKGPSKEDIRQTIETSHDVGREIENLVMPVDEQKALVICEKESLKTFLGQQSFCRLYFGNQIYKKLGAGIYLFFVFLAVFFGVFVLFGVAGVASMVLNSRGGYSNPRHEVSFLTKLTYGNMKYVTSINFDSLKAFMSDYLDKMQDEEIIEEMNGTKVVVMKNQSGNRLGSHGQ